jgi:hypothetical protein
MTLCIAAQSKHNMLCSRSRRNLSPMNGTKIKLTGWRRGGSCHNINIPLHARLRSDAKISEEDTVSNEENKKLK